MEHSKVVRAKHYLFLKNVETESVGDILKLIGTGKDTANDLPLESLNSCLLVACKTRHRIRVHLFLQWGAHLECKDDMGNTPLLICSKNGCKDLVQLLLQRGADVNAKNSSGDTPLILSIRSPGHLDTTRLLLADKKIDVDRQNQAGYTALHTAIEELDLEAIRILLFANVRYDEDETIYPDGQGDFLKNDSDTSLENSRKLKESAFMLAKRIGLRNVVRILKTIYRPTPLLKACLGRYFESVRLLIDCQFSQVKSPNSLDFNIISEFLRNIQKEGSGVSDVDIQIVKELINYGASVNARNTHYSELPIASAVMLGNYQLVEVLCQYGAYLKFETISSVKSAVEVASENGQYEILKLLIGFNAQLTDIESMHHWPLRSALRNGHIQCAQLLLEHGAQLHENKGVLVFDAIGSSQTENLYFLCQVMPIEVKDTVCRYSKGIAGCFTYAVEKGNLDIINILLDIGADVNQKEYSDSPLAHTTDPDVMLTLIQKGANVNSSIGNTRQSPLISVSQKKKARFALKILLDAGANVNHCDDEGNSALHLAAKWGDVDNVKILIEYGADINITSTSGWTPLMEALRANALDTATYLIQKGANVNSQDKDGNTPLLLAVDYVRKLSDSFVFDQLIQAGANIELRNKRGFTPFLNAAESCSAHLELLIAAGADVKATCSNNQVDVNALELILRCCKSVDSEDCQRANDLLNLGFDAKEIDPIVMHKIILNGHVELVQRLMAAGLLPSDEDIYEKGTTSAILYSPIATALRVGRPKLARFFMDNGYLTKKDLSLSNDYFLEGSLELSYMYSSVDFLHELRRETKSLQMLSFFTISFAVGYDPQREERVHQLPLPQQFKEKLLFKKTKTVEGLLEEAEHSQRESINSWSTKNYFCGMDSFDSDDDY